MARLTQMSPNTERRYREALEAAGLLAGDPEALPELEVLKEAVLKALPIVQPEQQVSSITRWELDIQTMLLGGARPTAIYDRLRLENKDFEGSLSAVKRLCLRLKKARGVQAQDVAIPVETPPGQVAQVDFGYVGKLYDPQRRCLRKAYVFVMVLGFSRHMVARIVFDQKVETWLRLHIEAFAELGGVPQVLVPDNLKAAVVRAAFGVDGVSTLNRSYRELARYYGFKVDPAPPNSPEKKGKVESGVKYVKGNFFKPRAAELDVGVLRSQLAQWVVDIAGQRNHGTTGRRPIELFAQQEHAALQALPERPYDLVIWRKAKVHPDTCILFEKALYSVPWKHIGKPVLTQGTAHSVCIYVDDVRVATHERVGPGQRSIQEDHLPAHRRDLRHRSRSYWEQRANAMGPDVGRHIREVFDSDEVLYQLRAVQQIVTYLEQYPPKRAQAACRRAGYFANYTYGAIKQILTKALDFQPFLPGIQQEAGPLDAPKYARTVQEMLPFLTEEKDAPN